MKERSQPKYEFVVFRDAASGYEVLTKSTRQSDKRITWKDGKEYPLIEVDISSASHPFFTGKEKLVDREGRIERFERKFGRQVTTK